MVFNELREAIVTRLKEAMPKEVDVAGHPVSSTRPSSVGCAWRPPRSGFPS